MTQGKAALSKAKPYALRGRQGYVTGPVNAPLLLAPATNEAMKWCQVQSGQFVARQSFS